MENKKIELLKPKYDVVFQALFGSNKQNITQSFISDILGKPVEIIEIRTDDPLMREYPNDKTGRLDLKTKFKDGTICQIEVQMADEGNTIKRLLYYWSKSYSKQLQSGDLYSDLNKTIGIIITNYNVHELKDIDDLDTKWQIMDTKTGKKLLTDDLELHIIMLSKVEKALQKDKSNRLAQWLAFMDNPNTERVDEIVKENEEVKKAKSVLYEMSEDEKLQRLAELREKWERDEASAREYFKTTGYKEGQESGYKDGKAAGYKDGLERGLQEGIEQGMEQGLEQGLEQGIEQGIEQNKLEIARKMKAKRMNVQDIAELTGLTKEEIEKI